MYKKLFFFCLFISVIATGFAFADAKYPERPIQALCAYAPGASTDAADRVMAEFLKKYIGQSVVVVNKPGGGGAIAGNELFKSKPDGYTIGLFNENQPTPEYSLNPDRFIYKAKDIQPVAQWSIFIPAVFTRYDAQWKSLPELIDYAKKHPGTLKWGHNGRTGLMYVIGSLIAQQAGIKMLDVPFDSDAQIMTALLGNHIDLSVSICGAVPIAQMEAKKVKPLAVATQKRTNLVPNIPTAEEQGYPLGIPDIYLGTFVTAGTPADVVAKISAATKKTVEDPEFKEKMKKVGFPVWYRDTKDFEGLVDSFAKTKWMLFKKLGVL